jgi:hypothetical protein
MANLLLVLLGRRPPPRLGDPHTRNLNRASASDHALDLCRRKSSADKLDHHDDPQSERRSTRTCRAVASQRGDQVAAHFAINPQPAEAVPLGAEALQREYEIVAMHVAVE